MIERFGEFEEKQQEFQQNCVAVREYPHLKDDLKKLSNSFHRYVKEREFEAGHIVLNKKEIVGAIMGSGVITTVVIVVLNYLGFHLPIEP